MSLLEASQPGTDDPIKSDVAAVVLCNVGDDDEQIPPKRDNGNAVVNGPDDVDDLAALVVRRNPVPIVPLPWQSRVFTPYRENPGRS